MFILRFSLFSSAVSAALLQLVLQNHGPRTIWPMAQGDSTISLDPCSRLEPHTSCTATLPFGWKGRVWAREFCDWSGRSCHTGNCAMPITESYCNSSGEPATLLELNLDYRTVWYDVSIGEVKSYSRGLSVVANGLTSGCVYVFAHTQLSGSCRLLDYKLRAKYDSGRAVL